MLCPFELIREDSGKILQLNTDILGDGLLAHPRLNKGSAFTAEEREKFHLQGKLPYRVETLEEQAQRIYQQYQQQKDDLGKNIYLNALHDTNETLFYFVVGRHLEEMLPIIYTPTIGHAVEQFSLQLRRPRGLYLSYPDQARMALMIDNRSNAEIDLVVITDGERVLGLGDQGIGGMNISIGKLMVYVLCAGVNPLRTLAITLDVGTNNPKLLQDPTYLGWKHERITGQAYDDFIDISIRTLRQSLPNAYIHWEDFGRDNARRNLERYRHEFCTFNDDMQGTGAVALAAILAGIKVVGRALHEERIVFFGAGTAGTGIADQLFAAMVRQGIAPEQAQQCFYLVDKFGLLTEGSAELTGFQRPYARTQQEIQSWDYAGAYPTLAETVRAVKPTILVGCSSMRGAFTEDMVRTMALATVHPIILPLSNPTEYAEARPEELYAWSEGRVLLATGSPFGDFIFQSKKITIAQCNNAFIFPGIGLGVIACRPTILSDAMIWAAAETLSEFSPLHQHPSNPLLPDLSCIRAVSRAIALRVITVARQQGLATYQNTLSAEEAIAQVDWQAQYYPYERTVF